MISHPAPLSENKNNMYGDITIHSANMYLVNLLGSINSAIPAKFHDFSVMLTNLKDSHDLTIVFWKIPITHELKE